MTTVLSSLTSNKPTMFLCHPNSFPLLNRVNYQIMEAFSSFLRSYSNPSTFLPLDRQRNREGMRRDTYVPTFVYQTMKIVANKEL